MGIIFHQSNSYEIIVFEVNLFSYDFISPQNTFECTQTIAIPILDFFVIEKVEKGKLL